MSSFYRVKLLCWRMLAISCTPTNAHSIEGAQYFTQDSILSACSEIMVRHSNEILVRKRDIHHQPRACVNTHMHTHTQSGKLRLMHYSWMRCWITLFNIQFICCQPGTVQIKCVWVCAFAYVYKEILGYTLDLFCNPHRQHHNVWGSSNRNKVLAQHSQLVFILMRFCWSKYF